MQRRIKLLHKSLKVKSEKCVIFRKNQRILLFFHTTKFDVLFLKMDFISVKNFNH